jgi:thioesterase domain-containing protein
LLVPIQTAGSKPPFFWVWKWNDTWIRTSLDVRLERYLDSDQPLYWLLHQCHGGKRAVYSRLEDIAAQHLKEIRIVQPEGPYFLGGSDFGGMVAFEIAQQLHDQGQQVALLFLLDLANIEDCKFLVKHSPTYRERLPKINSFRDKVFRHFHNLALLGPKEKGQYLLLRATGIIRTITANMVKYLACNVCWATGYPLSRSLRRYNIFRVDRRILAKYEPRSYIGPVILIKAKDSSWDPSLIELVASDLEIHEVLGNQHDMTKEPYSQAWVMKLKRCLSEAQAKAASQYQHVPVNDDPQRPATTARKLA